MISAMIFSFPIHLHYPNKPDQLEQLILSEPRFIIPNRTFSERNLFKLNCLDPIEL